MEQDLIGRQITTNVFAANEVGAKLVWCSGAASQQVLLDSLLSSELRYWGPIVADPGAAAPITRKGGAARGAGGARGCSR